MNKEELHKTFHPVMRNEYMLNLFAKIMLVILGVISSAFLTRYFGIKYRGEYAYISQFVVIIAIICNLGINQSYSYFYKKNNGGIYPKYSDLFFFQLIVNLAIFGLLAFLLKQTIYMYVALLLPFMVVTQNYQSCMAVENIKLKIQLQLVVSIIKTGMYVAVYLYCHRELWIPIVVTIVIDIFTLIVYIIKMNHFPNPLKASKKIAIETIRYSWVFLFSTLLLTVNYSIDILFLKHMGTSEHLSLYSTAASIINYVWLIPDIFKEVLISRVSRTQSIRSVLLSIKISLLMIGFVFILFWAVGKYAIQILYGNDFSDAYLVTMILIVGAFSMTYFKVIGVLLMAEGRKYFYFFILLLAACVNIILNCWLIPLIGMYGAAIASVMSYSICGLCFLFYFIHVKNLNIKEVLLFSKSDIDLMKNKLIDGR